MCSKIELYLDYSLDLILDFNMGSKMLFLGLSVSDQSLLHSERWWHGGRSVPPTVPAFHNGGTMGGGGFPTPELPLCP